MAILLVYRPDLTTARQDKDDLVLDGVIYGNHIDGDVIALPARSIRVAGGALLPMPDYLTEMESAITRETSLI